MSKNKMQLFQIYFLFNPIPTRRDNFYHCDSISRDKT